MSNQPDNDNKVKIGISIGDVNGIGMEVIIKTFADNRMLQDCCPVIYGSSKAVSYHRKLLNIQEFNFNTIRQLNEASFKKLNLINCWDEEIKFELGKSTEAGGRYAFKSLQAVAKDLLDKKIDALVTAPINKKNMQQEGFRFPGHTEYLADLCSISDYAMLMVSDKLRVGFATGHVALKQVSAELSIEKIFSKIQIINQSLKKDFRIRKPKIAVLALNPHAGDGGLIGKEEVEIISPAIKMASDKGILANGPFGADGFFGNASFKSYDAVLAMYHDQGLIPFKSLAFETGVNYTAGLSVIRTSPDHGTGYDIAGKNLASEDSFRQAVYLACDIARNRSEYDKVNANPLKYSKVTEDR